jgi:putative transposase
MYNPAIHHRRSIRLKGYDYSQPGLYFITICVQGKACLFGDITNGEMHLNDAGRMVEKWYLKLEEKFPDIRCGEHIVMPNHFHCIIENVGATQYGFASVGAAPCGRPTPESIPQTINAETPGEPALGEHMGSPLREIIGWFKTMTTNEYIRQVKRDNWPRFDGKLWQRNYWEHIIRNRKSHQQIAGYIIDNPATWSSDFINPANSKQ